MLVPYKMYHGWYRQSHDGRNASDEHIFQKYTAYREDFNNRVLVAFFDMHKDEHWMKEKYHPEHSKPTHEQDAAVSQENAARFVAHVQDYLDLSLDDTGVYLEESCSSCTQILIAFLC